MAEWYISRKGTKTGPFSQQQLQRLARNGEVVQDDLLWTEEVSQWTPAVAVPGLEFGTAPHGAADASGGKAQKAPRRLLMPLGGGVIAIALLVLALLLLLPSGEASNELGSFSVSSTGGRFEHDALQITIAAGEGEFAVREHRTVAEDREDIAYQSPSYELEGAFGAIRGEMRVEMHLPREALALGYDDAEDLSASLFIVMKEEVFTRTGGVQEIERHLDTTIDLETGTISAVIHFDEAAAQAAAIHGLIASTVPVFAGSEPTELARITEPIAFEIRRYSWYWQYVDSPTGRFRVIFLRPERRDAWTYEDSLKNLLEVLYLQKAEIMKAGFSFDKRTTYPIEIHLVKGLPEAGYFAGSKRSDQGGIIKLRQELVIDDQYRPSGVSAELRATIGHEMLHLAQQLYDPRAAFWKNHPFVEQHYYWLDEATAVWFEPYAVGQSDYLSENASINTEFIRTPLYFPGSTVGRDNKTAVEQHGYGASLFFRFLSGRTGDPLYPSYIYNRVAEQSARRPCAGSAVNEALWFDGDYHSLRRLWPEFLAYYLLNPERIAPGLETTQLARAFRLQADRFEEDEDDYRISFFLGRQLESHQTRYSDGSLQEEVPATLGLRFDQQNLTADALLLTIATDTASQQAFRGPGRLVVDVENSGPGGVLVYAENRDGRFDEIAGVAREPANYLYSQHSLPERWVEDGLVPGDESNPRAVIESFGLGENRYRRVAIVPFNHDSSPHELHSSRISLAITFEPAVEPEEEEEELLLLGRWDGQYWADNHVAPLDHVLDGLNTLNAYGECLSEEFQGYHGLTGSNGRGGCEGPWEANPDFRCGNERCYLCYPDTWFAYEGRLRFTLQRGEEGDYALRIVTGPYSYVRAPLEPPGLISYSVTEGEVEFDRGDFYFKGTINPEGTRMEGTFEAYHYRVWPERGVCESCGVLGSGTWWAERQD